MPLTEATLKIPFMGGISTQEDQKTVPSAQLLVAENVVFSRATSLRKRNGYDLLSGVIDGSAATLTGALALASRDDELLAFTSDRCFSRQDDADQWSDAGPVYSVVGTDRPLVRTGTQQLQPDHATLGNVTVSAWEDSSGGVWWSATDAVTGRIYRAATQADAAGISPRCVAVGVNLHVYYAVAGLLYVVVVSPLAPSAAVAPVVLTDDLDPTSPTYDVCPTTRPNSPALIVWCEAGTAAFRLGYVDQSGVLGGALNGNPSVRGGLGGSVVRLAGSTPIACAYFHVDGDNGDAVVTVYIGLGVSGLNVGTWLGGSAGGTLAATGARTASAASPLRIALTLTDATSIWVAVEEDAVAASNRSTVINGISSTSLPTLASTFGPARIRSVGLASRAFAVAGSAFAVFVHDTTFFNTYLTLRLSDFAPVGRHAVSEAAGAPVRKHLSSANVVTSIVNVALPVRERLVSENNDKFRETGVRIVTMDFASTASHQHEQLGRGLYLAGACAQHYDGRLWTEQGFHFGPELIVTTPAAGGSMTASTVYEYVSWYESTDGQGEVHLGPTSTGTLVTMGGSDTQVTLTLPPLRVTRKTNVRVCIARSLAGKTGNTAQKFRVTSLDPTTAGAANGYVANSTTVDTVTFLDRMDDVTLLAQEELYTDGGILSNDPTAIGSVIARSKNRLFATDPSNGNVIRYSQSLDDGYGVEWPPDLSLPVDPFGGDVTALASQDDRVVVFKASAIFVFNGDGPDAAGQIVTSGFTTPQLVTSDVGCSEPNSIVLTPDGHMFQSAKGIYLLDRGGTVSYIGARVEAYNAQRIARATVLPDRTQVVFLTDSGSTLLFDHYHKQWSTFPNHEGLDSEVVNGAFYYLRTNGSVYRETIGSYTDAGIRIRMRLETAWLHMHDYLQGFSRFWETLILGTWVSPHQLGIQYQTDYTEGWSDPYWLDATGGSSSTGWITGTGAQTIGLDPITGTQYGDGNFGDGPYGGTNPGVYQWHAEINERGQSIRFRFEDFEAAGLDGASFELTELLIVGGAQGKALRPFSMARST